MVVVAKTRDDMSSLPGVTFRPGRPHDAERLTAYHHRCCVEAFGPLLGPDLVESLDPQRRRPAFDAWLSPDTSDVSVVVAALGGVAVGHTVVAGREVVHLFVDPEHWGAGIGRQLLQVAEGLVAANGFDTAELHTIVGNEPAIRLYEAAGWTVTDRIVRTDDGEVAYDEHVLLKRLPG